ncbi:pyridoxamine 5'-phosphate oxidase family protein [Microbacterium elymi]|uniref:Pyridoxamine 5'-phosphate oxidase family protein n=1 Tax=Microbacterium elymi TaxID=2909587 RepID=A0ABY5NLU2_9MICO|nr:pyridoxamine 5'-phosphate oxidase family protein [Microbacterium elymi]UUT36076.1 pyridoxamine 5'-phosphate oxidase family protein [Microbacterium elymi]
MEWSERQLEFLNENHAAAMITIARDGTPKAVRVGVALVDGRLWSSGTADRIRTTRLRHEPRCTLFVFDKAYAYLTIESTVTLLDGPDAPQRNLELFRVMQRRPTGPLTWYGEELDEDAFLTRMAEEHRLVYEFAPTKAYGLL